MHIGRYLMHLGGLEAGRSEKKNDFNCLAIIRPTLMRVNGGFPCGHWRFSVHMAILCRSYIYRFNSNP